jgi:hypothetical protein
MKRKACEGHRKNPEAICDQKISHKKDINHGIDDISYPKSQNINEFRLATSIN